MIKCKLMQSRSELAKEVEKLREETRLLRQRIVNITNELNRHKGIETTKKIPDYRILYNIICDKFNIDIEANNRYRTTIDGRRMYYYWMCTNTGLSLTEIANTLKLNHHHTTIIWMRESHEQLIMSSRHYERDYLEICSLLNNALNNSKLKELEDVINPS